MEDERAKRFFEWRRGTTGVSVGKGNYGTVFKCGDGAVVKVVNEVRKTSGSAKLAYREHVMSLLQSVLVLRRHTPHLPLHYGLEASCGSPKMLSLKLYLEAFDCSLDAVPADALARPSDWTALLYQVGSAVLCVAKLLDVCHNDLYPRNVLLRRHDPSAQPCLFRYDHFGVHHELCWHSLAVLTDFGVCSGPLLASRAGPEVKRTPVVPRSIVPFGRQPPGVHVLNHTYLPPYSRDPYMLFKWGAFRSKGLPRAPQPVAAWCRAVLDRLDSRQAEFSRPDATLAIFDFAFSPETLGSHDLGLQGRTASGAPSTAVDFRVASSDRSPVLEDCTELLSSVSPLAAS
jgi:serine/threonine protein kinase